MVHLMYLLVVVSVMCLFACSPAQSNPQGTLLSKCNLYKPTQAIALSDILFEADQGLILETNASARTAPYERIKFSGSNLFMGAKGESLTLLATIGDNRRAIDERLILHNEVSFLMNYVRRPPSFGYFGFDKNDCNIIPVVVPGVKYWVFLQDGKISLFEPVSEDTRLNDWIHYFLTSRYGQ